MPQVDKIKESIFKGNGEDAVKYTEMEMTRGTPWTEILEKAMIPSFRRKPESSSFH